MLAMHFGWRGASLDILHGLVLFCGLDDWADKPGDVPKLAMVDVPEAMRSQAETLERQITRFR